MSLSQIVTAAPPSTKIRCAILCTALADALGSPNECHRRFKFPFVDRMIRNPNLHLPKGVWTDDTSMTLCLARSIASDKGFDEEDQLAAYTRWWKDGVLSATGKCFDIGNTILHAVGIYVKDLLPGALKTIQQSLVEKGVRVTGACLTTHPNEICQEACEVWTGAWCGFMPCCREWRDDDQAGCLALLCPFPYENAKLRQALAYTGDDLDTEHPIMKVILGMKEDKLPEEDILPSTGHVLHTLVAALFCFFSTDAYDAGALRAANLGNDADTVALSMADWRAVGMGRNADEDKTFWTDVIKTVTAELVAKEQTLGKV
ncbi:ADP-ribosylglycohydrolase [Hymenopellis radicata]|nr:ADP-ribosylglycohydrolase [Hymenopellis radicata]